MKRRFDKYDTLSTIFACAAIVFIVLFAGCTNSGYSVWKEAVAAGSVNYPYAYVVAMYFAAFGVPGILCIFFSRRFKKKSDKKL